MIFRDSTDFYFKFFGSRDSFDILEKMLSKFCENAGMNVLMRNIMKRWNTERKNSDVLLLLKKIFIRNQVVQMSENGSFDLLMGGYMRSKYSWIANSSLSYHISIQKFMRTKLFKLSV